MCDLLWSDPDDRGGWGISPRGAGYTFGQVKTSGNCLDSRVCPSGHIRNLQPLKRTDLGHEVQINDFSYVVLEMDINFTSQGSSVGDGGLQLVA